MDRYFTVMIIPEREKGVRSFRIPRVVFHTVMVMSVLFGGLLVVLGYDYWKILQQIYENKHLSIENRQLREQIKLFQMKINTLSENMDRIYAFEQKLRVITGLDEMEKSKEESGAQLEREGIGSGVEESAPKINPVQKVAPPSIKSNDKAPSEEAFEKEINTTFSAPAEVQEDPVYQQLKKLYEEKMATTFGLAQGYTYTKEWSELSKKSFALADDYALIDYQVSRVDARISILEMDIHQLDQHLLDKESFLRSTPTLLPARGWITSYYGPRISPYSGRLKMHEGLDVGARIGTPIVAPADGIVTYSGVKPGFGIIVQLDHGYGVETLFAHAQRAMVKKGQNIKRGHLLAQVGNTGNSTGPHLHYEIRVNGTPIDPLYYVLD